MPAPTADLPVTGTAPRVVTAEDRDAILNAALALLWDDIQLRAMAPALQPGDEVVPRVTDPEGYEFAVFDATGKVAFGVSAEGVFRAPELAVSGFLWGDLPPLPEGYADVVYDEAGNIVQARKPNGALCLPALEVAGRPLRPGNGARLTYQVNLVVGYGQSLGEGSTPSEALTTTQEYDLVGFPARAASPAEWVPLTVADTQYNARGESPIYGTLGNIKALLEAEHNLPFAADDYLLVGVNDAVSGRTLDELKKGTSYYANITGQVQAAYGIALAQGQSMAMQAFTFTQGEADALTDPAVYKAALIGLAEDMDADARAITGQGVPVRMITYQTATHATLDIAQVQLDAANGHPLIFMACPMYQFEYGDELHITATSSKWLGGYYGLAYKRAVVDGEDWSPLQPQGHSVLGNAIDLAFNRTGLVFDTTSLPAQPDMGFSVVDGSGVAQSISGVSILGPNRVRLTMATAPASGWVVRYGENSAVGRTDFFTGGCGNLRDSQGDALTYAAINKPLHNWCTLFRYSL